MATLAGEKVSLSFFLLPSFSLAVQKGPLFVLEILMEGREETKGRKKERREGREEGRQF